MKFIQNEIMESLQQPVYYAPFYDASASLQKDMERLIAESDAGDKTSPEDFYQLFTYQIQHDGAKLNYCKGNAEKSPIISFTLGWKYYTGQEHGLYNTCQDHTQAKYYFETAAELKNTLAHYYLGLMHFEGQGIERSYSEAFTHMEKAYLGGEGCAAEFLGCMCWAGLGTLRNIELGLDYFCQAHRLGVPGIIDKMRLAGFYTEFWTQLQKYEVDANAMQIIG